jgi:hypothetical protein
MAKELTAQERVQYLKALELFGPQAHEAGVEALRKLDSGEKPRVTAKAADTQYHASVDALALPGGIGDILKKVLKCVLKCASHIPNWPNFASCVLACMLG